MENKRILFFLSFLCFFLISHAQSNRREERKNISFNERHWMVEITAGVNIDLMDKTEDTDLMFMVSRPVVVPAVTYKVTHLFCEKMGWYAHYQASVYPEKRENSISSGGISGAIEEAFVNVIEGLAPNAILHMSLGAGFVYRIEKKRWAIYPQAGIGYTSYLSKSDRTRSSTKNDVEKTIEYTRRAFPLFMNLGFSVNYLLSKHSYMLLETKFYQPLQKSYGELVYYTNDVETNRKRYDTKTAGRSLNVNLGIGIYF